MRQRHLAWRRLPSRAAKVGPEWRVSSSSPSSFLIPLKELLPAAAAIMVTLAETRPRPARGAFVQQSSATVANMPRTRTIGIYERSMRTHSSHFQMSRNLMQKVSLPRSLPRSVCLSVCRIFPDRAGTAAAAAGAGGDAAAGAAKDELPPLRPIGCYSGGVFDLQKWAYF